MSSNLEDLNPHEMSAEDLAAIDAGAPDPIAMKYAVGVAYWTAPDERRCWIEVKVYARDEAEAVEKAEDYVVEHFDPLRMEPDVPFELW